MNPESYHSGSDPLTSPTPSEATSSPPRDSRYWARPLLVCNPFFLVSAALLVQGMAAMSWIIDAVIWTRDPTLSGPAGTVSGVLVVIVGWIVICQIEGMRPSRVPLLAAFVCLWSSGPNWILRPSSDGLLIVLGSFALFAIGAAVAWTRHRWETPASGTNVK